MNSDGQEKQVFCGQYEVISAQKPGGMARVFKVRDTRSNRTLALKLPIADSHDSLAILAFQREREALENLRHPHIVELVDAGRTDDGEFFLALEWLPVCLSDHLAVNRAWHWEEFYSDVGAPLIAAIAASHNRNIAHRDIKPGNLRFDDFGRLKVTDFGIAKARASVHLGETFRHAGSPPYTPPEADDDTHSFARDTYSWAAVALGCLTGKTFSNYDDVRHGLSTLTSASAPLGVLQRCLSLKPSDRPANGSDLQAQLEDFHRGFTSGQPLEIAAQIGQRELTELAQKLGGRQPDDCLRFLHADLNGSLHAYVVSEEERLVRLLGASLDITCKALEGTDLFRISSVRVLEPERAEGERRLASNIPTVTVRIVGPLERNHRAANQKAFWLRLQTEEGYRHRERDKQARERWFDCWTAVLREKDRVQRDRRLRIPFSHMRTSGNNVLAICEGEIDPDGFPQSLVYRLDTGRFLIFEVLQIFGDEVTLRPQNLHDSELPKGPGTLESNYHAQSQPIMRQRTALDTVRRDRATSAQLKALICDPSGAQEPEVGGVPPGFAADLNDEKRLLLERAVGVNSILLVEGPPGTGKTTFIAELIRLYLHIFPNARVLLSSQTHTALDHVIVKLLDKGMAHEVVRIHGERLEKIDERSRALTLDRKTRLWIELVEERARDYVRAKATQLGLNAEELEIAILGQQRHILLEEIREQEQELQSLASDSDASPAPGFESEVDEVGTTSTLIDEREEVAVQLRLLRGRLKKLDDKLTAYGEYGRAVASSSDEVSKEWIAVLGKAHVPGAQDVRSQVELQMEWFARLGASRDFHGAVLGEARVVAGTCVGLGNVHAMGEQEFDLCIVDEVSKATPTETLIPMSRSKRWVLVGDPKQLPPYSDIDLQGPLEQRFSADEIDATLLDILTPALPASCKARLTEQRRMVGGIGRLISDVFYDSQLVTIRSVSDRNRVVAQLHSREVEWHTTSSLAQRREREMRGRTYRNLAEAGIVHDLLKALNAANHDRQALTVAVIAGYSAQVNELAQRIFGASSPLHNLSITINTVDAFQGKDADICIYSVTRSNEKGRLGFQREARRLNVALSRGRDALIIVGDDVFCRNVEVDNPFRPVLAHIDNHPAECAVVSHDRL